MRGDIAITTVLTPREIRILRLRCEGKSLAQIASILRITKRTATWHSVRLLDKVGITRNARGYSSYVSVQLMRWAIENGIVTVTVKRRIQK